MSDDTSGERDWWLRRLLIAERAAWLGGAAWGDRNGYLRGTRQMEATWPAIARRAHGAQFADIEAGRWHVCCKPCRTRDTYRLDHDDGCTRCEDRTRDTYRLPHPDDYPGTGAAS